MITRNRLALTGLILCGTLFLFVPALFYGIDPNRYRGGYSKDEVASRERNTSAISRVLGELRTSASDIMFIKTERYLHNGVGYAAHIVSAEDTAGDHRGTPTLIRDNENDFRGFVGYLEREVKPWRDPEEPHIHSDGSELLPWYRLMTISDPHYVRAYLLGGWWLKNHNIDEGIKFTEEGIKNNPDAFQIYLMHGRLHRQKALRLREAGTVTGLTEAAVHEELAMEAFRKGAELVFEQRPQGMDVENIPWWTDYVEDDARGVVRMAVFMERERDNYREALDLAERGLAHFDEDLPLANVIADLKQKTAPPGPLR